MYQCIHYHKWNQFGQLLLKMIIIIVSLIMNEKKLVEVFRTFFQKTVMPAVIHNDQIMREWNHLNKIISADSIDYTQIEFYLLLSNKNTKSSSDGRSSQHNIGSANKIQENDVKYRLNEYNNVGDKNSFEKKGSLGNAGNKKKTLIASLEGFQKMLIYNQDRLETLNRKEGAQSQNMNNQSNTQNQPNQLNQPNQQNQQNQMNTNTGNNMINGMGIRRY